LLNALNKNEEIRFPIQGKVSNIEHKISLLIQAQIAGIPLEEQSKRAHNLSSEAKIVYANALRICRGTQYI
jgi:hypothetical protein